MMVCLSRIEPDVFLNFKSHVFILLSRAFCTGFDSEFHILTLAVILYLNTNTLFGEIHAHDGKASQTTLKFFS